MGYIVIHADGDGDFYVNQISFEEVQKMLKEYINEEHVPPFMSAEELLKEGDPMYWGDRLLIIKGEVIVPEIEEVIKKYKIP